MPIKLLSKFLISSHPLLRAVRAIYIALHRYVYIAYEIRLFESFNF